MRDRHAPGTAERARTARYSLVPREHGAYGQLGLPLLTALLTGGPSAPGLWLTLAATSAFLAHEPLLLLLGRRGSRARRQAGARAAWWFIVLALAATVAGAAGAATMPSSARAALLLPGLLMAVTGTLLILDRERSALGETCVAATLTALAVPVAAAVAPLEQALAAWTVWSAVSIGGMLGVRALIAHHKHPVPAARRVGGSSLMLAAAISATAAGFLTALELLAAVVPLSLTVGFAAYPPHPRYLRRVGWSLLGANLVTLGLLVWAAAGV